MPKYFVDLIARAADLIKKKKLVESWTSLINFYV